jgi:hypothetical protein
MPSQRDGLAKSVTVRATTAVVVENNLAESPWLRQWCRIAAAECRHRHQPNCTPLCSWHRLAEPVETSLCFRANVCIIGGCVERSRVVPEPSHNAVWLHVRGPACDARMGCSSSKNIESDRHKARVKVTNSRCCAKRGWPVVPFAQELCVTVSMHSECQ